MAEKEYAQKLHSLRRYVPFLVNMMDELKVKGNREAQLHKIRSLHNMITTTKKKLQLETLNKCEQVLDNIYAKVNPQLKNKASIEYASFSKTSIDSSNMLDNVGSTPASPSPPPDLPRIDPILIPTEKIDSTALRTCSLNDYQSHFPKVNVYNNVVMNTEDNLRSAEVNDFSNSSMALKHFDNFVISGADKIDDSTLNNATLEQLQEYRKQLQLQIEDDDTRDSFSKSEQSTTIGARTRQELEEKSKEESIDLKEKGQKIKLTVIDRKRKSSHENDSNKVIHKIDNTLAESASSFGNMLSNLDKLIENKHKQKKGERRDSYNTESVETDFKKSRKAENAKTNDRDKKRRDSKDGSTSHDKHRNDNRKPETSHKQLHSKPILSTTKETCKPSLHISRSPSKGSESKSSLTTSVTLKFDNNESKTEKDGSVKEARGASSDNTAVPKATVVYKRLSDKYNRKPKRKTIAENDAVDIDKNITDIIEKSMKVSPISSLKNPLNEPKIPLLGEKIPDLIMDRIAFETKNDSPKTKLPEAIQKLFNDHSANNNIASLSRKDSVQTGYSLPINPYYEEKCLISPQHQLQPSPNNIQPKCSSNPIDNRLVSSIERQTFLRHIYPVTDYCNTSRLEFDSPVLPDRNTSRIEFEAQSQVDFNHDYLQYNNTRKLNFIPPDNHIIDSRYNVQQQRYQNLVPKDISVFKQFNQYDMAPITSIMQNYSDNSNPYNPSTNSLFNLSQYYQTERPWYEISYNINSSRSKYSRDPRNYKEYKEMKERRERELLELTTKQKGTKDPRLLRPNKDVRLTDIEKDGNGSKQLLATSRDPRISRLQEKSEEKKDVDFKGSAKILNATKFDQMYSTSKSLTSESENFASPLDSLYSNIKTTKKTGLGYGIQSFKIPKKSKVLEPQKDSSKQNETVCTKHTDQLEITKNESQLSKAQNEEVEEVLEDVEEKVGIIENPKFDFDLSTVRIEINWQKKIKLLENRDELVWNKGKEFISEYELKNSMENEDDDINDNDCLLEPTLFLQPSPSLVVAETPMQTDNFDKIVSSEKLLEPSEQNILASFFQNLLKSKNKKDKKSALCSLIETFSDTFEEKEIHKIRKIINDENEINSDGEETGKVTQPKNHAQKRATKLSDLDSLRVIEEIPEVGSTTNDDFMKTKLRRIRRISSDDITTTEEVVNVDRCSESQIETDSVPIEIDKINKINCGSDEPIKEANRDDENKIYKKELDRVDGGAVDVLEEELEPVVESVGERIKNRRRANIAKPKKRSELDQLHEDIKEMFIRDGVLTATGKRMCRILKDDPNALSSKTITPMTSSTTNSEISKKIRKKSSLKNRTPNKELENSMKDVRILINKMPDNLVKKSNAIMFNDNFNISLIEIEGKNDNESDDDNKSRTSEGSMVLKQKGMKKLRRGKQWAAGIIPKGKRKKSINKSKESTPEVQLLADKMYYIDFMDVERKKLKCKFCDTSSFLLVSHYTREHPDCEVLCSRLSPQLAEAAIIDFSKNTKVYGNLKKHHYNQKMHRYNYCCRICNFSTLAFPISFYDHCSTHTGEYRHRCNSCGLAFASAKSLAKHFVQAHPKDKKETQGNNPSYTYQFIFAYVCGECNYVQMGKDKVEQHVKAFHSTKPLSIFKISMSSAIDPQFTSVSFENVTSNNGKINSLDTISINNSKMQKKNFVIVTEGENGQKVLKEVTEIKNGPGPKSKTITYVEKITVIENEPAKPNPKSQTTNVIESADAIPYNFFSSDENSNLKKKRHIDKNEEPPNRKRNRSLDNLIISDNGDDLDTIITLSSRSSRVAKEKATAKLKTLMENNEESIRTKRISNVDQIKKKEDIRKGKEGIKESTLATIDDISAIIMEQTADEIEDKNIDVGEHDNNMEIDMELEEPTKGPSSIMEFTSKILRKHQNENKNNEHYEKMPDLTVFTCQTDIQEDKEIEEARLRKLDEVNKIIGSRSSKLDMADKLCNRLNSGTIGVKQNDCNQNNNDCKQNKSTEIIKTEPDITSDNLLALRRDISPVKKITQLPKKPIIIDTPVSSSTTFNFRQNKCNTLFSNTIEKLQNNINKSYASRVEVDVIKTTTPLLATIAKPTQAVEAFGERSDGTPVPSICIGDLINITRRNNGIYYSCRAKNCYLSTEDKSVFELHCKFGHQELKRNLSLCESCGILVTSKPNTGLLQVLYEHLITAHSNFMENNSYDISNKQSILRMRRLSGDKLSLKKKQVQTSSAIECPDIETSEIDYGATVNIDEDNPFSFRIANVVSLATELAAEDYDSQRESSRTNDPIVVIDDSTNDIRNDGVENVQEYTLVKRQHTSDQPQKTNYQSVPPLTPISGKTTRQREMLIREIKMTASEKTQPKKASKALQKFINTPGHLYKCPHFYCMYSTNMRMFLERHLKAHITDNPIMVPCVYCDVKTCYEQVPMHIDLRHSNCQYACKYCLYRACLKEYVLIHQEQIHKASSFIVMEIPIRQQKRYCLGPNLDYKSICKPYICLCKIGGETREFLFEHEFSNHLKKNHMNVKVFCGHFNCPFYDYGQSMVDHWNHKHDVWRYQCGYCNVSCKTTEPLYIHLTQFHSSCKPDILVRYVDNISKHSTDVHEFGYTQEAFDSMFHIRKLVFKTNGNQKSNTVKIVKLQNDDVKATETISDTLLMKTMTKTSQLTNNKQVNVIPAGSAAPSLIKSYHNSSRHTPPPQLPPPLPAPAMPQPIILSKGQGLASVQPKIIKPVSTSNQNRLILPAKSNVQLLLKSGTEDFYLVPSVANMTVNPNNTTAFDISTGKVAKITRVGSYKNLLKPEFKVTGPTGSSVTTSSVAAPMNTVQQLISINKNSEDVSCANVEEFEKSIKDKQPGVEQRDRENDILQTAINSILDEFFSTDPNPTVTTNTSIPSTITNINQHFVEKNNPIIAPIQFSLPVTQDHNFELNPPPLTFLTAEQSTRNTENGSGVASSSPLTVLKQSTEELLLPVEHVDVIPSHPIIHLTPPRDSEGFITIDCDSSDVRNSKQNHECVVDTSSTAILQDPLDISSSMILENSSDVNDAELSLSTNIVDGSLKASSVNNSILLVSNSDDEFEEIDKGKKKGLTGNDLYRCAICRKSSPTASEFKNHLFHDCTISVRPYRCFHCGKSAKSVSILLEHIQIHGIERFICTLCDKRFNTLPCVRTHMKSRHSIQQTSIVPIKYFQNNTEVDLFVIKPFSSKSAGIAVATNNVNNSNNNKKTNIEKENIIDKKIVVTSYKPDQIDMIPIRQIFNDNVKCGLCNFQTKVRVNIVRHLQMHLEEACVPESVPINPVPCLEKNEKMFDKMYNMAASSLISGSNKLLVKNEEKFPEFVPTHCRFVCCARGCSYLCPEEGNLKHHLMALHSDETEFTCAHCKIQINPTEADSVIKHFRLHGLHLYKCHYCQFIHYLKHKVERHVNDGHLNATVKVTVLRSMEAEPQDTETPQPNSQQSTAISFKFKPWRCCMCKYRSFTKEEMESHVKNRHEMDAQYKCTLCTYKSDTDNSFKQHFADTHPQNIIDIISVYQKVEEESVKLDSSIPFDTTPLWQRDKPRVRHIRGILFDESTTTPSARMGSPKKPVKSSSGMPLSSSSSPSPSKLNNLASSVVPLSSCSKNLWDCIDAVASGTAEILQDRPGPSGIKCATGINTEEYDKQFAVPDESLDDIIEMAEEKDVIVIGSDESDSEADDSSKCPSVLIEPPVPLSKDKDNKLKPMAKNRNLKRPLSMNATDQSEPIPKTSEPPLKAARIVKIDDEEKNKMPISSAGVAAYGNVGTPYYLLWQCPKCNDFKTKTAVYFMFHLFKEFDVYRYKCKVCDDYSITQSYMQVHINVHPDAKDDVVELLSRNFALETWVRMVIREQSVQILKKYNVNQTSQNNVSNFNCIFCSDTFGSINAMQLHTLKHWATIPYQCKHCLEEFYIEQDLVHHHNSVHPNMTVSFEIRGATLEKALQNHESAPVKQEQLLKRAKRNTEATVTVLKKRRILRNSNDSLKKSNVSNAATSTIAASNIAASIVSMKTSDNDNNSTKKVFACDLCAWLCNTLDEITKHTTTFHGINKLRFHMLTKKAMNDRFACNVCDKVLPELMLRRHFLDNHFKDHSFFPYKYQCGLCARNYLAFSNLTLHFKRYHPSVSLDYYYLGVKMHFNLTTADTICLPFACIMCSFSTASYHSMRLHLKMHLRPICCNICKERFKFKRQAVNHHNRQHHGRDLNIALLSSVLSEINAMLNQIKANSLKVKKIKNVARKSTSAAHVSASCNKFERVEIKVESRNSSLTEDTGKSVEEWLNMYNMDSYVDLNDCTVNYKNYI